MNFLKITAVVLVLALLAGVSACSTAANTTAQVQTSVTNGNISVKISGTGKTGFARDAKLAFGTAGKIEKVNIKKGDAVPKDMLLAQLETDNLGLALTQARVAEAAAKGAVTQAQMALNQAQISITQAQLATTQAQMDVTQAEQMETQAEAAQSAAQFNLDKTRTVSDIKDDITNAEWQIKIALMQMKEASRFESSSEVEYWKEQMEYYGADLSKYQNKLAELLNKEEYNGIASYEFEGQTYDRLIVEDVRIKQQQLKIAQQSVDLAKQGIEKAKQNVNQANQVLEQAKQNTVKYTQDVEQAKLSLEQAIKAVEVAQHQLDSATIIAPFDGIVADLDITQDDFIITAGLSSGIPIYMVDPHSLEVSAEVDELDIAGIQAGQKAVITLDAVPGQPIEGKVISISLLPIQKVQNSGVVVFEVKVGFNGNPPAWAKAGMSASVEIVTSEKSGVILAPNKAIKQNGLGQKVVVVWVNQKSEERAVVLGLTDGTQTEVVSGLEQGEIVLSNP
jgi:HlyD family secretion protein